MKKLICLIFIGCSIMVLTGCNQKTTRTENIESTDSADVVTTQKIDSEKAKNIALDDAGLKEEEVAELSVELDNDNDKYEVNFKHNGKEYDYDIEVTTGNIIDKDVENDD